MKPQDKKPLYQVTLETDCSWLGFWLFMAITSVAFNGEPDLIDALIHYLMKGSQ